MLFSHRKGLKPVRQKVQLDEVDIALRNGVWNALLDSCWLDISQNASRFSGDAQGRHHVFLQEIWADYFKLPIDSMPREWH
jgi:hypothetical protein